MSEETLNIALSKNEALVLFELLSRFSDTEKLEIEHQSEVRALWNLTCLFEKELTEPFKEDYEKTLNEAREALKDKDG